MAMTLVSTVTVGSGGAASIEFTGIAATGKDLLILISLRNTDDDNTSLLSLNGSTSITGRGLRGTGSAVTSVTRTNSIDAAVNFSSATASTFSNTQIYISNYTSSVNKSISVDGVTENNATLAFSYLAAMNASVTSAITSLKLEPGFSTWKYVENSTISLYIIS